MARRRSRVEGPNKLRQKLRRFPEDATKDLRKVMEAAAVEIERDAIGRLAASRQQQTGDLLQSISHQMSRDGLSFVVGPGVKGAELARRRTGSATGKTIARGKSRGEKLDLSTMRRRDVWNFIKGYWLEFGTKGSDGSPRIAPMPFMSTAYEANRARIQRAVRNALNRAINKAAR